MVVWVLRGRVEARRRLIKEGFVVRVCTVGIVWGGSGVTW